MYETRFIIQTNKPFHKEDLALIGTLIKEVTDELEVDRIHLGNFVKCHSCGYFETEVNPTKTIKDTWKCRNCGGVILQSMSNTYAQLSENLAGSQSDSAANSKEERR